MKLHIEVQPLLIPMKEKFAHASAERQQAESLWVVATRDQVTGLGEGCPRPYVTGESLSGALEWAQNLIPEVLASVFDLATLKSFVKSHQDEIDKNPSAWCALELALLDLFAREAQVSLEKLLGVSETQERFQYSAVLGVDDPQELDRKLTKYLRFGFNDFKLKVVGDQAKDLKSLEMLERRLRPWQLLSSPLRLASSLYTQSSPLEIRLRWDANNAWAGRAEDLEKLFLASPLKPWAVEEPFAPFDFKQMSAASTRLGIGIILDESLCRLQNIEEASHWPGRWIANVRVSKLGGLLRTLEIIEAARGKNWEIIIGAQVGETSVLSRAALVVARAVQSQLKAQEGAFGTRLLAYDKVERVVMFGLGGVLQHRSHRSLGWGLTPVERNQ